MATWFKAAEGLLEAVDRTAKQASGKDSSDFLRSDSLSASGNTTRAGRNQPGDTPSSSSPTKTSVKGATRANGSRGLSPATRTPLQSRDASPQSRLNSTGTEPAQRPSVHPRPPPTPPVTRTPPLSPEPAPAQPQPNQNKSIEPGQNGGSESAASGEYIKQLQIAKPALEHNLPEVEDSHREQLSSTSASPSTIMTSEEPHPLEKILPKTVPERRGQSMSNSLATSMDPSTADAVARAIREAANSIGLPEEDEREDGRTKEQRLTKMIDSLRRKVDQLKFENEQLEELLRQADAASHGKASEIGRLEDEIAKCRSAESTARAQLISSQEEWQKESLSLRHLLEESRAQNAKLQSQLDNSTERNERLFQEQEDLQKQDVVQASETRMLTALRAEIAASEQRLEDERFAAASARQSFAAREHELEATLSESAAALTSQQRLADERGQRLAAAEQRASLAEAQAAQLRDHADTLEAQVSRLEGETGQSGDQSSRYLEAEERISGLQAALNNSEVKRRGLEAEVGGLRSSLEEVRKQPSKTASSLDSERRLQEMTELLYEKQSLLERMAAERSAQQLAWEQQLSGLRDDAERVKRKVKTERAVGLIDEGYVVCMEDLGGAYQKLANNRRVGKAVKAGARWLDSTTLSAIKFLRQYPVGRLVVVAYIIFIHLFVYTLIHHLQQKAMNVHPLRLDDG